MTGRASTTVLLLLLARPVLGCSCGRHLSAREALPKASAVFTGVVVARRPILIRMARMRSVENADVPSLYPGSRVDIAVSEVFKGDVHEHFELTELGCCICEYPFAEGKEYLIFAEPHWEVKGESMASFCGPTKLRAGAIADLAVVAPPRLRYEARTYRRSPFRWLADVVQAVAAPIVRRRIRGEGERWTDPGEVFWWSAATIALAVAVLGIAVRGWMRASG